MMKKTLWIYGGVIIVILLITTLFLSMVYYNPDEPGKIPEKKPTILWNQTTCSYPEGSLPVMFQADPAHTGDYTRLSCGIIPEGKVKWKLHVGSLVYSSPVVWNGTVYIISKENGLNAVDATTGILVWRNSGYSNSNTPAINNGTLYSSPWHIEALDATTGTQIWEFHSGNAFKTPVVVNGMVFAGDGNGDIYAFDARTGKNRWNFTTIGDTRGLAVSNDTVYLMAKLVNTTFSPTPDRSMDRTEITNRMYALNADTGTLKWVITPPGNVSCGIAITDGTLYAGTDNNFNAFDAINGEVRWSRTINGYCHSAPAVADGIIYVGSDDANLYALDTKTGTLKWNYTMKEKIMSIGGVYAPSPAFADGIVYAGGIEGRLYALDAKTGFLRWYYPTKGYIWSSPAIVNGVVYFGSNDGYLYAIE
jgi:outer membrane protein assembly factor BamB